MLSSRVWQDLNAALEFLIQNINVVGTRHGCFVPSFSTEQAKEPVDPEAGKE